MTYGDYIAVLDDSHPMTTAREHIAQLCHQVVAQEWRVLELGSHKGISTAAMALAAPKSTIVSVDLCDTVSQAWRESYWAGFGLTNIIPVQADAGRFLRDSQLRLDAWDFIFHDAVHGEAAVPEYLTAAGLADRLAIHDWEQLAPASQARVAGQFRYSTTSGDSKGRVLFMGWR